MIMIHGKGLVIDVKEGNEAKTTSEKGHLRDYKTYEALSRKIKIEAPFGKKN